MGKPVAPAQPARAQGNLRQGADQQEIKFRAPVQARYIALVNKNAPLTTVRTPPLRSWISWTSPATCFPANSGPWSMRIPMKRRGSRPGGPGDEQPAHHLLAHRWRDNPHPHMIVLDLGKVQKLSGFPLPAAQSRENGRIKDYEVYASPKPFKPAIGTPGNPDLSRALPLGEGGGLGASGHPGRKQTLFLQPEEDVVQPPT